MSVITAQCLVFAIVTFAGGVRLDITFQIDSAGEIPKHEAQQGDVIAAEQITKEPKHRSKMSMRSRKRKPLTDESFAPKEKTEGRTTNLVVNECEGCPKSLFRKLFHFLQKEAPVKEDQRKPCLNFKVTPRSDSNLVEVVKTGNMNQLLSENFPRLQLTRPQHLGAADFFVGKACTEEDAKNGFGTSPDFFLEPGDTYMLCFRNSNEKPKGSTGKAICPQGMASASGPEDGATVRGNDGIADPRATDLFPRDMSRMDEASRYADFGYRRLESLVPQIYEWRNPPMETNPKLAWWNPKQEEKNINQNGDELRKPLGEAVVYQLHIPTFNPRSSNPLLMYKTSGAFFEDAYPFAIEKAEGNSSEASLESRKRKIAFEGGNTLPIEDIDPSNANEYSEQLMPNLGGDFISAIEKLPYLADLGVNVIELLPVTPQRSWDTAGYSSWAYAPLSLCAIDFAKGGSYGFKKFIDAAASHGMTVGVDLVYNHMRSGGFQPVNAIEEFFPGMIEDNFGPMPNFDNAKVREYMYDCTEILRKEFRIPYFRWDSTTNMRRKDGAERNNGTKMMQEVNGMLRNPNLQDDDGNDSHQEGQPSLFWPAISVAEDEWDNSVLDKKYGFDSKWGAGFAGGWRRKIGTWQDPFYGQPLLETMRAYDNDLTQSGGSGRVVYTEKHDNARNERNAWLVRQDMLRNSDIQLDHNDYPKDVIQLGCGQRPTANYEDWVTFRKTALLGVLPLTAPGIPMLLMGQEIMTFEPLDFNYPTTLNWGLTGLDETRLLTKGELDFSQPLRDSNPVMSNGAKPGVLQSQPGISKHTFCNLEYHRRSYLLFKDLIAVRKLLPGLHWGTSTNVQAISSYYEPEEESDMTFQNQMTSECKQQNMNQDTCEMMSHVVSARLRSNAVSQGNQNTVIENGAAIVLLNIGQQNWFLDPVPVDLGRAYNGTTWRVHFDSANYDLDTDIVDSNKNVCKSSSSYKADADGKIHVCISGYSAVILSNYI